MARKINQLCQSSSLTDLKLYQYGSVCLTSNSASRPFISAHYSILYIRRGSGTVRAGNPMHSFSAGNAIVIFPNQVRSFATDTSVEMEYIEVDGKALLPELTRLGLSANHPVLPLLPSGEESKTAQAFRQLLLSEESNEAQALGLCWGILGSLLEETAQRKPQRSGNQQKEYVRQAKDIIHRYYMRDLTVEEIAVQCQLNRSYLGKLFRDETGESTQEYLIRYRMSVACRFLLETTAPIGVIALSVGYPNQLHFSRAFHKIFGISPREWQKQQRIHTFSLQKEKAGKEN